MCVGGVVFRAVWGEWDPVVFADGLLSGFSHSGSGRIEHLRGIAPGFRNRANHETRVLLHSGQIHRLHH